MAREGEVSKINPELEGYFIRFAFEVGDRGLIDLATSTIDPIENTKLARAGYILVEEYLSKIYPDLQNKVIADREYPTDLRYLEQRGKPSETQDEFLLRLYVLTTREINSGDEVDRDFVRRYQALRAEGKIEESEIFETLFSWAKRIGAGWRAREKNKNYRKP